MLRSYCYAVRMNGARVVKKLWQSELVGDCVENRGLNRFILVKDCVGQHWVSMNNQMV